MAEAGIVVIGVGEVRQKPSTLQVRIGVSLTRASVRQATADATARAHAVISALQQNGVAEDDIQTAHLNVGPFHEHVPGQPARLVGYTFTNTVSATLRDLDRSGDVLDAALAAGGDDAVLDGVTFAAPDADDDVASRARALAFEDARRKAEHLAELAGVTLGAPVSIDETGALAPISEPRMARMAMAADMATPIAAGQISSFVRLRVCFAIV